MRKLILLNNLKTTLTGTLADTATTLARSLLTSDIIPVDDLTARGEFEVRATLTDDTNIEIVGLVFDNGAGVITLERGLEGTTARTWNAGAKFEFRLTAGMLNDIRRGFTFHFTETDIATAVNANALWPINTLVTAGNVYVLKSGANFTYALVALQDGMTDVVTPAPSATTPIIKDFQVYWAVVPLLSDGSLQTPGATIGNPENNSYARHDGSVAIGNSMSIGGLFSYGLGSQCENLGNRAVVVGPGVNNYGDEALVITPNGGEIIANAAKGALVLDYIPAKVPMFNFLQNTKTWLGGAEGVIWTPPMDLTGGAAWTANNAVGHGQVRRPTVANGFQYSRFDNNYGQYTNKYKADYVPGNSGASQPTWPTVAFDSVFDGDGYWICMPNVGMTVTLPDKFIPKEIGILVLDFVAISAQPSLSFGKSGNNALFKANGATTLLTAADKVQIYDVTAPEATDTLTFSINTLATGTMLLCQFFVRGQLCPRWY